MVFYEIRITAHPVIRFAHTISEQIRSDGHNIIDHRKDMMEISCCSCDMLYETEYESFVVPKKQYTLVMPDCRYDVRMTQEGISVLSSVGVSVSGLYFRRYSVESYEEIEGIFQKAAPDSLFLPQILTSEEEECAMMAAQFQTIIRHYLEHTAASNLRAIANWYEMLAYIDTTFRQSVKKHLTLERAEYTSAYYYIYKAKKYICAHYRERLTLRAIAETLGISSNYFCTIFRKDTGQTVMEYINGLRMQEVREIISREPALSLNELCERVGLHDTRHLQRLFKKHYGVSIQRCRKIDNGLSLYHKNPWKESEIEQDIYERER